MLKAKRNYKQAVKGNTLQAIADKYESPQAFMSKVYEAQDGEFGAFLAETVEKDRPFPFLVDMKAKHDKQELFSENMANAIRKCMKREAEWQAKAQAKQDPANFPTITLKLKPFIMQNLGLDSRVVTGKVKAESAKAWLLEGQADMLENMSWCVRCGRQLSEPASQVTGMGATCAEKTGMPYDATGVLSMTKRQRQAIRKKYVAKLQKQKFETWIPKSQAEIIQDIAQ